VCGYIEVMASEACGKLLAIAMAAGALAWWLRRSA
jgi:hypothetical protein